MKPFFAAALLLVGICTGGCQSAGPASPPSLNVKSMVVNDVSLAYVEEGSGTTVLFIHGASGDWRSWESVRPAIASKYRFVSLSRRYHHPNAWADDGTNYTWDQHVEDIAAFIRALNSGKVHLVGNSYGGRLVGVVALKYPELLRSVVLGEPSIIPPGSEEGKAALNAYVGDLGKASAAVKAGDDGQAAILLANAVAGDPDGFGKLPVLRQQWWLDNQRTVKPMFSSPSAAPVSCEQLRAVAVPVLAVRGELTRANFKHGHEALVSCLPKTGEVAVIPNGTHFWAAENPGGASAAVMLSFFDKH